MSDRPIIERTLKSLFPNKDITHEPFYLESLNLTTQDFITTKLKHTCRRHTSNISPAHLGAFLSKASAIDAVIRFHKGREGTLDGPFPTLSRCQQWFQAFSLQKMASANTSTGGLHPRSKPVRRPAHPPHPLAKGQRRPSRDCQTAPPRHRLRPQRSQPLLWLGRLVLDPSRDENGAFALYRAAW